MRDRQEVIAAPLFGHLSDSWGRTRISLIGASITGVYGFVLFAAMDSGIAVVAFLRLPVALIPHGMQYGPQASLVRSPSRPRCATPAPAWGISGTR